MAFFTKMRSKSYFSSAKEEKFDNLNNIMVDDKENNENKDISLYSKHNSSFNNLNKLKTSNNTSKDLGSIEKEKQFPSVSRVSSSHSLNSDSFKDNRFSTSRSVYNDSNKMRNDSFYGDQSMKKSYDSSEASIVKNIQRSLDSASAEEEEDEENDEENVENIEDTDELFEVEESKWEEVESVFSKARHNHSDFILDSLLNGFNPNTKDRHGNTLLHICAQNNNRKLASLILKNATSPVDINAINLKSLTPLDYCEKYGFLKMYEWLELKNAKPGKDNSQFTSRFR